MKSVVPLFLLCWFAQPSLARATSDFQFWSEIGLRAKLSDSFRLDLDGHLRLDDNASRIKSLMPEIAIRYKLFKFLSFKSGYRNLNKPDYEAGGDYVTWHRFFFDVRLRKRFKPITLRYRLRYQEQFHIASNEATDETKTRHTLRNRVSIGWKVGHGFEPFAAGELFIRFGDKDGLLRKWRTTLGCQYEIDAIQLAVFYRIDNVLDNEFDPTAHILGLSAHYSF